MSQKIDNIVPSGNAYTTQGKILDQGLLYDGSSQTILNVLDNAVKFDGVQNDIDFGNILLSNTKVSVCAVISLPQVGSSVYDIVFGYGNTRWFFILSGAGGGTSQISFSIIISGSEKSAGYTTALALNTSYFVCGTYDPTGGTNNLTISVYSTSTGLLVYSSQSTQTGNIDSTGKNLQLAHDPNRNFFTHETAQNLAIYSRIITAAEMSTLALNGNISATNLIGQWNLQEGTGTNVVDSSGSGNNGTLSGSPLPTWVSGAYLTGYTDPLSITYNNVGYDYGGLYGSTDVQPLLSLAYSPAPSIIGYSDIYTKDENPLGHNAPGWFMFINMD